MTTTIIITLCVLLLFAYVFDISSSKTKIPSVILLLLTGWGVRELSGFFDFHVPNLTPVLSILGTIGLILIVLEGSLEIELNKSKAPIIKKSFTLAFFPMIVLAFGLSYILQQFGQPSLRQNLINVIPFCVISSAIAIPSVKYLTANDREFVIYESSLSDILGILFFNFVALNESFGMQSLRTLFLQLIIIAVVSFVATYGLAFLLNKIEHHIKFLPIILLIILIYAISKVYHLPGLVFILFLGLFLGNLDGLKKFKEIQILKPDELSKEVHKFKELTIELTFLTRALFFLLFGYLIKTSELLNTSTLIWAIGIVAGIFILRAIQLKISKLPYSPLLFIAPRGLITILLFLSIEPVQAIPFINESLIIQVIVLSAFVMMFGLMTNKTNTQKTNT